MLDIPIHGHEEQVDLYCKAFKAMQAELGSVPKNKSAPIGNKGDRFSFADYGALVEYLRPFFDKHGFFHQATPGSRVEKVVGAEGEYLALVACGTVTLTHEGGAFTLAEYAMPAGSPREAGAIHTYCRRYALGGLAGIYSDEDTDAAGIENPPPQQAQKARQEPPKQDAKAQPSGDKDRARKGADAIQKHLKKVASNEKVFADYKSQVDAHSVDAWGENLGALVAKGWDKKVEDVYRWAVKNVGVDNSENDFLGNMSPEAG